MTGDGVFDFTRPGAGLVPCERRGCDTLMISEEAARSGGFCRSCRKEQFKRAEARENKIAEQANGLGGGARVTAPRHPPASSSLRNTSVRS
jgi:hypothetical protein